MKFIKALLMASFLNIVLFAGKAVAEDIWDFSFENRSSQVVKVAILKCNPAPLPVDRSFGWSSTICNISGWYGWFQPNESRSLISANRSTKPNYQVVTSIWLSVSDSEGHNIALSNGKTQAINSCSYLGNPYNSYYCNGIRTDQSFGESFASGRSVTFYETELRGTGTLRFTYNGSATGSPPSLISGIYRGINVWGVLRVTALNNSTFSADDNNENQYFTHFTNGTLVSRNGGELIWNITTRRTNRSNACITIMSGTLTQRSNNTARVVYTSTDGRCDIPTNFSSATELRKN